MLAGLTAGLEMRVGEEDLSPELRERDVEVLSTPRLIRLLKETAMEAIQEHLASGMAWFDEGLRIRSLSPVPVGMKVTAHALLKEVQGDRLLFLVDAYDEVEKVAEGELEMILISKDQLHDRIRGKRGNGKAHGGAEHP